MEKHIGLPLAGGLLVTALIMGVPIGGAHATSFRALYAFPGGSSGADPLPGLIQDTAGNLRGATANGGARSYGVVIKLAPDGTETVLRSLTGRLDP